MTKCVLIIQLEIPQISNNFFGPSAGKLFWIFFEQNSHHMSIVHDLKYKRYNTLVRSGNA